MAYDQIITCLEQKQIILTKVLNFTKQIEVRCKQPDVRMDDLLETRGIFLERMTKCNRLIATLTEEMPKESQKRLRMLLEGNGKPDNETEQEKQIEKLATECRSLVQRASMLDNGARELLQTRLDEVKKKIKELHPNDGSLFYVK